jgi:hypothetical protein
MATMIDCGPAARELLSRLTTPTRNRYYFGKLLDAYHLELEQVYGNRKRWLLNRLSLGTGVLCGLEVKASVDRTQVRVGPGVAIDGWGREIVVERDSPGVDARQPTDDCGNDTGPPSRGRGRVTLWICYHECEAEPAPVLVSECERECENGLIRERYRLRITPGAPRIPDLVTTEQCQAIFSAAPDREARRWKITETLGGLCQEPAESCVPLAVIELEADAKIGRIDPIRARPMLYSNTILLELILCLATRVDECCAPRTINALRIVSGDGQQGDAGQPLAQPLVVRVDKGAAPVQGEQVTFNVVSGQGRIGSPPNLGSTFQVNTAADGTAQLPQWELGPIIGSQSVTASIAAGAPSQVTFGALARAVQVDLPIINAVWPPPRLVLTRDPATVMFYKLLLKFQSIELIFNRAMKANQLDKPDPWLRFFGVMGVRNQFSVVRLPLRHATAAEAADRSAALPAFAPGAREFFLFDAATAPPSVTHGVGAAPTGAAPAAGAGGGTSMMMMALAQPTSTLVVVSEQVRFLTLVNADTVTRDIVDQLVPPHLLDGEFQGSTLQLIPGAPGPTLWDDVWNVPIGGPSPVFGQNLWDAMTTPVADVLPSGNGAEGGRFDSWFGFQR